MRRALITGISGQDGSYLSERLLAEGWNVHALVREVQLQGESPVSPQVVQHPGNLADSVGLAQIVTDANPDAIFNLGGISSVAQSWDMPVETATVSGVAAVALFDAAWRLQESRGAPVRVVQASSSEIFGAAADAPQNEQTPLAPVSPYGAAKTLAHNAASVFRGRGLFVSSMILYNHESPRRPTTFVTRKITQAAAAIAAGSGEKLLLGNLDAKRDWGWAPDYVDAMVRAIGADASGDFVIATGVSHSVRELVAAAFTHAGVDDWESNVALDPRFARPSDVPEMRGDSSKAREFLGWRPSVTFEELVGRMVDYDVALLKAR